MESTAKVMRSQLSQRAYDKTTTLLSQWDENKEGPELLCPSLSFLSRDFFLHDESKQQDSQESHDNHHNNNTRNRSSSFPFPVPHSSSNRIILPSSLAALTAPLSSPRRNSQSIYSSFNLQEAVKRLENTINSNRPGGGSSSNRNDSKISSVSTPISDRESNLITSLTSILLNDDKYTKNNDSYNLNPFNRNENINSTNKGSNEALSSILTLFNKTPRRVCQHPFRKNDIVWVCRTCQSDETCVLCHDCYTNSNHEGHDVAFYHAQAGGCCDCGDPDAWDPKGFCHLHGENYKLNRHCQIIEDGDTINMKEVEERAKGVVDAIGDWLVKEVVANVEKGWKRTNSFSEHPNDSSEECRSPSPVTMNKELSNDKNAVPIATHSLYNDSPEIEAALKLGRKGLSQQGLYLTLHSDDIHTSAELSSTLSQLFLNRNSQSPHISKIIRLFKNSNGNLILWGTHEILAEVGEVAGSLWKDGDRNATLRIANVLLEKAKLFTKKGFHVYVQTHFELQMEQRAIAILHWLSVLARSCDALCEVVAHSLTTTNHLIPLLEADLKLPRTMTSSWHALLLTLLAIPQFKQDLAAAYCDSYGRVTNEYAKGVGVLDCSCFTLSVQFLNREKYVKELVQERFLLERLTKSLLETLRTARLTPIYISDPASGSRDTNTNDIGNASNMWRTSEYPLSAENMSTQSRSSEQERHLVPLNPLHPVLSHRRYSPCISDLKCVLNVDGMAREFAAGGKCLENWLELLSIPQGMDGQTWRTWDQGHVDIEPKGWIGAFNASISLGSLFERILVWEDEDSSPFQRLTTVPLITAAEVTLQTLQFISKWQERYFLNFVPSNAQNTPLHEKASSFLSYASVSFKKSSPSTFSALPVSQIHPWSFHYPLHRFAAACLRECNRRSKKGIDDLENLMFSAIDLDLRSLLNGLMEISLLINSRAAQIRAGMWRRNGQGMHDQVLNYAEPPFCRALRDSDLTILQFAIVALMKVEPFDGISHFTNLSVQRFGVFEFCGFTEAPIEQANERSLDMDSNKPSHNEMDESDDDISMKTKEKSMPSPQQSKMLADSNVSLILFEELLHLWILLLTEVPAPPTSASEEISIGQAKSRLRREVIHRLASGPKTHSELAEVHHVLPLRDNTVLHDEGKKKNPDDATGAALEDILELVATQQSSNNFGPNKWELNKNSWIDYDPAFWHIAQRAHQTIAESKPSDKKSCAYAPRPDSAHAWFQKLRWGLVSDAVVVSVCYRVLHIHFCKQLKQDEGEDHLLRGKMAYDKESMSETALSRTIYLLTLAAYAWDIDTNLSHFKLGNRSGSIFDHEDKINAESWIERALLTKPEDLVDSQWYEGEECALLLLNRLATEGSGRDGSFTAQDSSLKGGAKWLCEFAEKHSHKASSLLNFSKQHDQTKGKKDVMNLEQRKKEAQRRAMQTMMSMKKNFEAFMEEKDEEGNEAELSGQRQLFDSKMDDREIEDVSISSDLSSSNIANLQSKRFMTLLKERPQCIICNGSEFDNSDEDTSKNQSKSNKCALAFCAHAQASTVLKGGGGPPDGSTVSRFVGTHVALCGHAVHISCVDSYLATVAARDGSVVGGDRNHNFKKEDFRCPLCQRLSNCLVPFIDVGMDWIDSPKGQLKSQDMAKLDLNFSLNTFLSTTKWLESVSSPSKKSDLPVKSRRSISKKDLFTAWHAVMRPPRFRRRQLSTNSNSLTSETTTKYSKFNTGSKNKEKFSGVTDVWRRLMDQLSNVSLRADWKRLGEDELSSNYGEFRHYYVEKAAYNKGKNEKVDWPLCLFQNQISDSQKNELSREKLISKLLLSIQAFTYSICAEAADIRQRTKKGDKSFHSMFGIQSITNDESLILMPNAEGEDIFHGRLGNLRHLGLSIMAATSALAKEVINLVLPMNFSSIPMKEGGDSRYPLRSPIAYPLLYGHILTHVVAAMCAACGSYRAKSDAIGSNSINSDEDNSEEDRDLMEIEKSEKNLSASSASSNDCDNFIKIGFIGRILQVLLGKLNFGLSPQDDRCFIETVESTMMDVEEGKSNNGWSDNEWEVGCLTLLKAALLKSTIIDATTENKYSVGIDEVIQEFSCACKYAYGASLSFLSDCALFLQVLIPGIVNEKKRLCLNDGEPPINKLAQFLNIEPLCIMMSSTIMRNIVSNWYQEAKTIPKSTCQSDLADSLDCKREYRKVDWPLTASMNSSFESSIHSVHASSGTPTTSTKSSWTKKSVPLLGGYGVQSKTYPHSERPRIKALPTSYTDLYAELGALCPDTERATALCLVCGETLNASGRSECTKHALKCGAGSGIFFLVQECIGLIIHGHKAAYIHSPYVDSHGETPQYRGRPLNLDLKRYESLHEMWRGHLVRERVITERGSSRQIIIPNFY